MYEEMRQRLVIFEGGPHSYVNDFDLFFQEEMLELKKIERDEDEGKRQNV